MAGHRNVMRWHNRKLNKEWQNGTINQLMIQKKQSLNKMQFKSNYNALACPIKSIKSAADEYISMVSGMLLL